MNNSLIQRVIYLSLDLKTFQLASCAEKPANLQILEILYFFEVNCCYSALRHLAVLEKVTSFL